MKINGNAIRPGNVIEHQGRLWLAVRIQHTQPGKGGAYLQVELKDIRSGTKLNERFRSSEDVERVTLEERPFQYLYPEGDFFVFMDQGTFEQLPLHQNFVGDQKVWLEDGMTVSVSFHENEPLGLVLPDKVVRTVAEADPVVKGQTASSSYKPATLDNGVRTSVPPHIEPGMRIVVSTEDAAYAERAKDA